MRRNCNLELCLFPSSSDQHRQPPLSREVESTESPEPQQQLTIFYNGEICVCDVTEIKARAILLMASGQMEDKSRTPTPTAGRLTSEPASPTTPSQLGSHSNGLSMKRSLQLFLQKRKHRVQATSPYNH